MAEEKRYPILDEEDGSSLIAQEPIVASALKTVEIDDFDYNFSFKDLGYPHTLEELKADIAEAESEYNNPEKWIPSEQLWAEVRQQFPWANIK